MEKLEKLKKEREELDKRIETLEYAERIFEEGDEIYYVDQFGTVNCGKWDNFAWIDAAFNQGHIFRTKQAAELEAKRRNLLTRFRAFRDECNAGWKPNFSNDKEKYYLFYSTMEDCIKFGWIVLGCSFNIFGYFKNREDAQRAIELFGDEIKELFVECDA